MLVGLSLWFALPPLAGAAIRDCPPGAPRGGDSGSVLVAAMDGGACEHTGVGPCLTALGCVTAAPAIRPAAALLVTPARLLVLAVAPPPPVGDLSRARPPTPPPNLI
jgi:hypothetical protein